MFLSVIIPTYNESETIQEILHRVQATELAGEIVVVDDGSIDGTREILEKLHHSVHKKSTILTYL